MPRRGWAKLVAFFRRSSGLRSSQPSTCWTSETGHQSTQAISLVELFVELWQLSRRPRACFVSMNAQATAIMVSGPQLLLCNAYLLSNLHDLVAERPWKEQFCGLWAFRSCAELVHRANNSTTEWTHKDLLKWDLSLLIFPHFIYDATFQLFLLTTTFFLPFRGNFIIQISSYTLYTTLFIHCIQ